MIQVSVAEPVSMRRQPDVQEGDLADPLWRLAGDLRNARALIVSDHGLDLMCGLIRRGCPAATIVRFGDKPDAHEYGLVLVPRSLALPSADKIISLARRALTGNGRLIVGLADDKAAVALARRLRLNGFTALSSIRLPDFVLLCADLRRPS